MAKIISKLNLNKTPQTAENYSLIFAKNIKVMQDESIGREPAIVDITGTITGYTYVTSIPHTDCLFNIYKNNISNKIKIEVKYVDTNKASEIIDTGAICHNGSTIEGVCISNLRNDRLLVIGEYGVSGINIPLRVINLEECDSEDEESVYYVSPEVPITNLRFISYVETQIPNGTYQFYIRYKTPYNKYTKWFLCSKELRTYNRKEEASPQGTILYTNTGKDASYSFSFNVEHINPSALSLYKEFQLAYIVSIADEVKGKIWGTFSTDTNFISFKLLGVEQEDIDVAELLDDGMQLYNVENIAYFKNKVYISNYKENLPELNNLQNILKNNITVTLKYDKNFETVLDENNRATSGIGVVAEMNVDNPYTKLIEQLATAQNPTNLYLLTDGSQGIIELSLREIFDTTINNLTEGKRSWTDTGKPWSGYGINYTLQIGEVSTNVTSLPSAIQNNLYDLYHFDRSIYPNGVQLTLGYHDGVVSESTRISSTDNIVDGIYPAGQTTPDINSIAYRVQHWFQYIFAEGGYTGKFKNPTDQSDHPDTFYQNDGILHLYHFYTPDGNTIYYRTIDVYITNENYFAITASSFSKQTLIPYQKYRIYAHLVDKYGKHTRGYPITDVIPDHPMKGLGADSYNYYTYTARAIIYPVFSINASNFSNELLDRYKGIFFSVQHIEQNVFNVNNITRVSEFPKDELRDSATASGSYTQTVEVYGDSLDLDLLSYSATKEDNFVTMKWNKNQGTLVEIQGKIKYHYSGDFDADTFKDLAYIGASGKVEITSDESAFYLNTTSQQYADIGFVIKPWTLTQKDENILKCTPIIQLIQQNIVFDDVNDVTLGGFLCKVAKPSYDEFEIYHSSSEIYRKTILIKQDRFLLTLNLVEQDELGDNKGIYYTNHETLKDWIYSNYDLEGIELTGDLRVSPKTLKDAEQNARTYIAKTWDSLILADLYKKSKIYTNFVRKQYLRYDPNEKVYYQFDNTIRGSKKIGDEELIDVVFEPTEYYNVPTDKGQIVNLVSIGDIILVHTEHSMYKFSGSNSLTASGGEEIQTSESDVFDTGISEMYGSDKGYGGLTNKHHAVVSNIGYIFWDSTTNQIFLNSGQPQLEVISKSIKKLLDSYSFVDVKIANDYYNDRLIFAFKYKVSENLFKYLTISYSFITKDFASLHDYSFDKAFNTKTKAFILKNNTLAEIKQINNDNLITRIDNNFVINDYIFPTYKHTNRAIIDVIFNEDYETVKVLNSISWISDAITSYSNYNLINDGESQDNLKFRTAEEKFDNNIATNAEKLNNLTGYPGTYLIVFTDSAESDIIDLSTNSNSNPLSNDAYKKVRYNDGLWTLNYLRNILNTNNSGISDDRSLIYGKYFVVRFVFDTTKNFKIENLIINKTNKY